jgi:type II secretory pathway pseudopilin PulG
MIGIKRQGNSTPRARGLRRKRLANKAGFTLIELAISVSILMIGIVSVVGATSRMHSLRQATRDKTLAMNAMRSIGERIHAASARLSGDTTDWARDLSDIYGPGGSFGADFDVLGLSPFGDSEFVGNIRLVTDETTTDAALGFQVGMPRDLNGDADATDTDVRLNARILPVLLTVEWTGIQGRQFIQQGLYVTGY